MRRMTIVFGAAIVLGAATMMTGGMALAFGAHGGGGRGGHISMGAGPMSMGAGRMTTGPGPVTMGVGRSWTAGQGRSWTKGQGRYAYRHYRRSYGYYGYGGGPYYDYYNDYYDYGYDSCYVLTPYGWVWVCD